MTVNTQHLIELLTCLINKIKLWFWPEEPDLVGYCDTLPEFRD